MTVPVGMLGLLTPPLPMIPWTMILPAPVTPSHPCSLHSVTGTRGVCPASPPSPGSFPPRVPSSLLSAPAHPSRPVPGPASGGTHSGPDSGSTSPPSPAQPFTRPSRHRQAKGCGARGQGRDGVAGIKVRSSAHCLCGWAGAASLSAGSLCREQPRTGSGGDKVRL